MLMAFLFLLYSMRVFIDRESLGVGSALCTTSANAGLLRILFHLFIFLSFLSQCFYSVFDTVIFNTALNCQQFKSFYCELKEYKYVLRNYSDSQGWKIQQNNQVSTVFKSVAASCWCNFMHVLENKPIKDNEINIQHIKCWTCTVVLALKRVSKSVFCCITSFNIPYEPLRTGMASCCSCETRLLHIPSWHFDLLNIVAKTINWGRKTQHGSLYRAKKLLEMRRLLQPEPDSRK